MLRKLRFPRLAEREARFREAAADFEREAGVALEAPAFFESAGLTLKAPVRDAASLERLGRMLQTKSKLLNRVFELVLS